MLIYHIYVDIQVHNENSGLNNLNIFLTFDLYFVSNCFTKYIYNFVLKKINQFCNFCYKFEYFVTNYDMEILKKVKPSISH